MAHRPITAENLRRISKEGSLKNKAQQEKHDEMCRAKLQETMAMMFHNQSIEAAQRGVNTITFDIPDLYIGSTFLRYGRECKFDVGTMNFYATKVAKQVIPDVTVSVRKYCRGEEYDDGDPIYMAKLEW